MFGIIDGGQFFGIMVWILEMKSVCVCVGVVPGFVSFCFVLSFFHLFNLDFLIR